MTVRVKITVPSDETKSIEVFRESNLTGESLGVLQPGQSLDTYFWAENKIVIKERTDVKGPGLLFESGSDLKDPLNPKNIDPVKVFESVDKLPPQTEQKLDLDPRKDFEDTINRIISSRESYQDFDGRLK
jgi:hypothetical protein